MAVDAPPLGQLMPRGAGPQAAAGASGWREVFKVFLSLGLTSFGGPVAHLGYFRREFVARRGWLDEQAYADLVALCQMLPGPASSQVGIAVGYGRAGLAGALAAWTGFTLPSAFVMIVLALGLAQLGPDAGWIHGLKIAAVAVVAQAVVAMARALTPDAPRAALAVAAAGLVLLWPGIGGQLSALALGGAAGLLWLTGRVPPAVTVPQPQRRGFAGGCLALFCILLLVLPLLAPLAGGTWLPLFDIFYRAGALVFGGGHVVLPLLQQGLVPAGFVSDDQFLAGYGAVQAVPGPLFTFAAYLGTRATGGVVGGLFCLAVIFLPSFLLVLGVLPYWDRLRAQVPVQSALAGINAAVVGLLAAAFYNPVWRAGITTPADLAIGLAAFALLVRGVLPPWAVVGLCALAGRAAGG